MFRIGIIGAGWIAHKMATAISPSKDCCIYAIASRSIEKAEAFAAAWNIEKAYGSYEDMVSDPDVDLVYIATPHSHHFQHSMLALGTASLYWSKKHLQQTLERQKNCLRLPAAKVCS